MAPVSFRFSSVIESTCRSDFQDFSMRIVPLTGSTTVAVTTISARMICSWLSVTGLAVKKAMLPKNSHQRAEIKTAGLNNRRNVEDCRVDAWETSVASATEIAGLCELGRAEGEVLD